MSRVTLRVLSLILGIAVAAASALPAGTVRAQTSIVAVVNGEPITSYALNQRQRLLGLTEGGGALRSKALDELIDEKVQMQAAEKASVNVPEAEVDAAFENIAKRVKLSPSQLKQALGEQGVSVETLRDRLRAQVAFNRLIRTRFRKVLDVSEPELVAALLDDADTERAVETPEYNLKRVTVALPENPSQRRLRQAEARAADIRGRVTSCKESLEAVRGTPDVVIRPFGRRTAAELPPDAREAVADVALGRLSEPIQTPRGLVMFAVCDKRMIQSTNAAMKALEPEMRSERGREFSMQYVRKLRRDAVIERR